MADIYDHSGLGGKLTIPAALGDGNYVLGEGSPEMVSTAVFQITVASGTISIIIKGRSIQKNARRDGDNIAFVPIPYVRRNLGGTVSDDTTVSAAFTAGAIVKADVTGLQFSLEIDQTNGVGAVYWTVHEGSA